jgi:hypothetical protein
LNSEAEMAARRSTTAIGPESVRRLQEFWSVPAATLLVVRTRRRFFQSRPGRPLLVATLLVAGLTAWLPYSPLAPLLGFEPLPPLFLLALVLVVLLYMATAEAAKDLFYGQEGLCSSAAPGPAGSGRTVPPSS